MATRSKTIEFITTTTTSSVDESTWTSQSIDLWIPETITEFTSVSLLAHCRSWNTASVDFESQQISMGTSETFTTSQSISLGTAINDLGEAETMLREFNFVDFFNNNWSGTSNTWWIQWRITVKPTVDHTYKLTITYDYDDTSSTYIKTIRIPIESTRSLLTSTWSTIGGATAIPGISGSYLPESEVGLRQVALELYANEGMTIKDVASVQLRVNGGSSKDIWVSNTPNTSTSGPGCLQYIGQDITSEVSSSAVSLEARSLINDSTSWLGGYILVTYEYNPNTTTTFYNSILLQSLSFLHVGTLTDTPRTGYHTNFSINEPGPITLKESGISIFTHYSQGGITYTLDVEGQTSIGYGLVNAGKQIGSFFISHRIDGGGTGSLWNSNFNTGSNSWGIDIWTTGFPGPTPNSGYLVLNYTSATSSFGVGAHTSPRYFLMATSSNITTNQVGGWTQPSVISIPETDYFIHDFICHSKPNMSGIGYSDYTIEMEAIEGDSSSLNWVPIQTPIFRPDFEVYQGHYINSLTNLFKQYPDQPNEGLLLSSSRDMKYYGSILQTTSVGGWVTYDSFQYSITGSISGFSGTVNLALIDPTGSKILKTTTRSGDGDYSFTWHDNNKPLYVTADDGTNVGRSQLEYPQG